VAHLDSGCLSVHLVDLFEPGGKYSYGWTSIVISDREGWWEASTFSKVDSVAGAGFAETGTWEREQHPPKSGVSD
jgi:hypothetical protein